MQTGLQELLFGAPAGSAAFANVPGAVLTPGLRHPEETQVASPAKANTEFMCCMAVEDFGLCVDRVILSLWRLSASGPELDVSASRFESAFLRSWTSADGQRAGAGHRSLRNIQGASASKLSA